MIEDALQVRARVRAAGKSARAGPPPAASPAPTSAFNATIFSFSRNYSFLHSSFTITPASACFNTPTICCSVNRDFFIRASST